MRIVFQRVDFYNDFQLFKKVSSHDEAFAFSKAPVREHLLRLR